MDAGLWIVLRPGTLNANPLARKINDSVTFAGPYINAETSAGGIAHWVTSEVAGALRTNATDFYDAWLPYIQETIKLTVDNQITCGGPVIGE